MHRYSLVRDLTWIWGTIAVFGLLLLGTPGCATIDRGGSDTTKLAVQYGTVKLIGGDDVSAAEVIAHVESVRTLLDRDEQDALLSLDRLVEEVSGHVNWSRLDPADTLLLMSLIESAATAVADVSLGGLVLDEPQRVKLRTLLDWIEQAAVMAE